MDDKPETHSVKNWFKESTTERSTERVMQASRDVFHRFRVVQWMVLRENKLLDGQELKGIPKEQLEARTREIMEAENNIRKGSIPGFGKEEYYGSRDGDINMPFDMSRETISDGVRWYLGLQSRKENKELIRLGLYDLMKAMYMSGRDSNWVGERMKQIKPGYSFAEYVAGILTDKTVSVELVKSDVGKNSELPPDLIENTGEKTANPTEKMKEWVYSLADDINGLYNRTTRL